MSSAFQKLKKERENLSKQRREKIQNDGNTENYQDDRMYYPERDSEGNGYAVLRFLSAIDPADPPFVKAFEHGFKLDGGWYIENCPTTIGEKCPVCEANSEAWAAGDKTTARNRKRKKQYFTNVLVVSDPKNPDNEGQIRIFKFGQAIFDIIKTAANPEFEDEKPIDAFDMWDGANFKLKIVKKDNQTNYDRSSFADPAPLADTDEEIEAIWKKQHNLQEFIDPKAFKDYDLLAKRFARVSGTGVRGSAEDLPAESARNSRSESRRESRPADTDDQFEDVPNYELEEDDMDMPSGVEDDMEDDPVKWFEENAQ